MKVVLILEGLKGACPFYRSVGPFKRLANNMDLKVSVVDISQDDKPLWMHITDASVVYFERPVTPKMLEYFRETSDIGIKTWVDYDDNLMNIPSWRADASLNVQRGKVMRECAKYADLVTVSTTPLKRMFDRLGETAHVVPNAFDDFLLKDGFKISNKKMIFWRGSDTHDKDLDILFEAYRKIHPLHSDWLWVVIGGGDQSFLRNKKGTMCVDYNPSLLGYFKKTLNIGPSILLYPLEDHFFNYCKSNIAWLEATYFGAVTVAPNFSEWSKKGCILNYKEPQDIPERIIRLIENRELRHRLYVNSRRFIKKNLVIDEVNKIRKRLLGELCQN